MLEKKLYLKILRYLRKSGVNQEVNVYKMFRNSHSKPNNAAEVAFQDRPRYINSFLEGLEKDGYIGFTPARPPKEVNSSWDESFEVWAWITHKGYAYVTEQDSAASTKRLAVWAILIAGASLLVDSCQFIGNMQIPTNGILNKVLPVESTPLRSSRTAIGNEGHLLLPPTKNKVQPPSSSGNGQTTSDKN